MVSTLLLAAAVASAQPSRQGTPRLYEPAPRETPAPRQFDENDGLRRRLLASGDWYSVPAAQSVLLVVESGYLTDADLALVARDVIEAVTAVPAFVQRSKYSGRIVFYVYASGPMSEADVPGVAKDEKGIMLRFVKEDRAPVFHELTHLLAGYSDSQSLAEGFAEEVEARFRPGKAHAFTPAGADPDALAKAALARYPRPFYEAIGAPGHSTWSGEEIRHQYYFASWSFARWLVKKKGVPVFLKVLDAGGRDAAYQPAYGKTLAALRDEWRAFVESRP